MDQVRATQIINRGVDGLEEQIAWLCRDLSKADYTVPPDTANRIAAARSYLDALVMDIDTKEVDR